MQTRFALKRQSYQDSLQLMSIAAKLKSIPGIIQTGAVMGTEANMTTLSHSGFTPDSSLVAGPDDIVIALRGESDEAIDRALAAFHELLQPPQAQAGTPFTPSAPRSISAALAQGGPANLALISVPGVYAAREARKAIAAGLHVMIFSDNVSVDEEISLKKFAREKDLLVMGPDCGTAIIGGVPLCFANHVRRGSIGILGASGTGIQQATVLIDRLGSGVSHAIGTGGRDLSDAVGGITMLTAFDALEADPDTHLILLISKPPGYETAKAVAQRIMRCRKPVIVAFLDGDTSQIEAAGAISALNLEEAAAKAVALVNGKDPHSVTEAFSRAELAFTVKTEVAKLKPEQVHVRGLFSGGTLAQEAVSILRSAVGRVRSNIAKDPADRLGDVSVSVGDCVLDLGDDDFTKGRPHPMIDPSYRAERIISEHADPTVTVILCDVVLGVGSHGDPAGVLAAAVNVARATTGRYITVIASVCGTESDPQRLTAQENILRQAGVLVYPSNAFAAEAAGKLVQAARERGSRS